MLTNIQERVERSIFHKLRKQLVTEGYLPDITLFDIENVNAAIAEAEEAAFETAISNIVTLNGFSIEIYNSGTSQDKGQMKVPRIVLETTAFFQGEIGVDTTDHYELDGNEYNILQQDSLVTDYHFSIRLIGKTIKQIRTLHAIMVEAIPRRGYIEWYDEPGLLDYDNIHIRYLSSSGNDWNAEGICETVYRYEVKDLHERVDRVTGTAPPLGEIGINIQNIDIEIDGGLDNINVQTSP